MGGGAEWHGGEPWGEGQTHRRTGLGEGDPTDVDAKTMKSFESWDCVGSVCAKDARWHSAARPATAPAPGRPEENRPTFAPIP